MQSSSSKPFMIIFAIVALIAAGFALKFELSNVNKTEDDIAREQPDRMLVESPGGRIPEAIPDWFKRVGYKRLGFDTQQQMDEAQKMMTAKGRDEKTPDQLALLHVMLKKNDPPFPHKMGVSLLQGLRGTEARKEFIPDLKALYQAGSPNQNFHTIVTSWYNSGDKDLIKSLEKDPNKDLAAEVKGIVTNIEFPGKGM